MKTYKRTIPVLGLLLALIGLFLTLSFSVSIACKFANDDSLFIKEQTQIALKATSLEMARYHTYKALRGISQTKDNIVDCGCEEAKESVLKTEENLKMAARAEWLADSKLFLELAKQNILITIDALRDYGKEYQSDYGEDILVMNTKEVLNEQGGIVLAPAKQLQERMDKSLAEFESSLDAVVRHVECEDAFNFINKILGKSERHLNEGTVTDAQRQYHTRVKTIAYNALLKLEGCPSK